MNQKLTPKQQKFVDCYTGNATEAALKAGYSEKTARVIGTQNLTKLAIVSAIKAREKEPKRLRILSREERQNFWTRVALGEVEGSDIKDRLKATELLGRSEADFTDKLNIGGRPTVIIKDLSGE